MALSRLGTRGRPADVTWPGFVDALASLLMVFVFVLMVFVLIQANLSWRVSGQDASLSRLRAELSALTGLLNLEREENAALSSELAALGLEMEELGEKRDALAAELAGLRASLLASRQEKDSLTEQLASMTGERDGLANDLEAMRGTADGLRQRLAEMQTSLAEQQAEIDAKTALLAQRAQLIASQQDSLQENQQALASANNATLEAKAEIDRLIAASLALRNELEALQRLLAEKEKQAAEDKVALAALGEKLNAALANRVQELQLIRSEFFAQLRDILSQRTDIQIVGDRFVFQSEVLFAPGQARINPAGQAQLADIGAALLDIAGEIPQSVPWVLQVDGHTDTVPVSGRYTDNWDLSTERAMSVVRFLIDQGVPANRLAATGYGEFQPIDQADTLAARQKNRRIELKLTQRLANASPPR